ncbi:alkaline phosphatase D family protein [Vibrio sonorensis]|uniref:alkaline phosphatase D family protein n=1 Tax=Vibrio sonorensis TaxID=1004316 RepID=UPI0008D96201|nr:alkaline phosphatase D family protein [Vibrio sonorensis]
MNSTLPLILAGPILRKATSKDLVFWLATSEPLQGSFTLFSQQGALFQSDLSQCQQIRVGQHAYVVLAHFQGEFPTHLALSYEFDTQHGPLSSLNPHLLYEDEVRPQFTISTKADYILHGSCRNPHHPSQDALVQADKKVSIQSLETRPDMLLMSGDQIYADHVSTPMLDAVIQIIERLGLYDEEFEQAPFNSASELYQHPDCYCGRERLLPNSEKQRSLLTRWLPNPQVPIFSSRESENHLISLAEFMAMYLLTWSPVVWSLVDVKRIQSNRFEVNGQTLSTEWQSKWDEDLPHLQGFIDGLPSVARLLSHIPTYMIFDDHDITDDWNLTIGWEQAAYSNLFSKRVIGNGLIAYWLFQGWGNEPDNFNSEFLGVANAYFDQPSLKHQNQFIDYLYRFEKWHFCIQTTPKVVVLDTRTRRWRSESRMNKPSGLMDWEALIEFQQELMHQDKVIVVSAAPMFGVKFIEALQRGMTNLGYPLLIDAENWMAHPGSANTLLSIFTHTKTPSSFVILSGDVHYSFAYDIKLRYRKSSPNIYQITCSGIKNEFPEPLLSACDYMDRLLYSPRSPLNWLTKRKRLKIFKRKPDNNSAKLLVNSSAIGELHLDPHGKPESITILTGRGDSVSFPSIDSR